LTGLSLKKKVKARSKGSKPERSKLYTAPEKIIEVTEGGKYKKMKQLKENLLSL